MSVWSECLALRATTTGWLEGAVSRRVLAEFEPRGSVGPGDPFT